MTCFLQNPNDPDSKNKLTVPVLRHDIGFIYRQKMGFATINHRYKVETRFFQDIENNKLVTGFRFSHFRFRYQLGFDFLVWKNEKQQAIVAKIKDEIMFNFGNKIKKNF